MRASVQRRLCRARNSESADDSGWFQRSLIPARTTGSRGGSVPAARRAPRGPASSRDRAGRARRPRPCRRRAPRRGSAAAAPDSWRSAGSRRPRCGCRRRTRSSRARRRCARFDEAGADPQQQLEHERRHDGRAERAPTRRSAPDRLCRAHCREPRVGAPSAPDLTRDRITDRRVRLHEPAVRDRKEHMHSVRAPRSGQRPHFADHIDGPLPARAVEISTEKNRMSW